jgi:hypothetical protein
MIEWFDPAKKLPDDGQQCLIMGHAQSGLLTEAVFGPIAWNAKEQMWLDIFRDPEHGTLVKSDQVGCWTAWEPIKPPDGLPTPFPETEDGDAELAKGERAAAGED